MSSDSTRDSAPSSPRRRPQPPRWIFEDLELRWIDLDERRRVPKGVETIEVSTVVEARLKGRLDPGDMEWFDSYWPTLRIGEVESSRMEQHDDGVTFTFYPEVDGDVGEGPVEFRARLGDRFEDTGLGSEGPEQAE